MAYVSCAFNPLFENGVLLVTEDQTVYGTKLFINPPVYTAGEEATLPSQLPKFSQLEPLASYWDLTLDVNPTDPIEFVTVPKALGIQTDPSGNGLSRLSDMNDYVTSTGLNLIDSVITFEETPTQTTPAVNAFQFVTKLQADTKYDTKLYAIDVPANRQAFTGNSPLPALAVIAKENVPDIETTGFVGGNIFVDGNQNTITGLVITVSQLNGFFQTFSYDFYEIGNGLLSGYFPFFISFSSTGEEITINVTATLDTKNTKYTVASTTNGTRMFLLNWVQ
jgi:hypothetical protein